MKFLTGSFLGLFICKLCLTNEIQALGSVSGKLGILIVGGEEAVRNEFSSVVNLRITFESGDRGICGGSIIHPSWVLTAAHCIHSQENIHSIVVTAGDHNRLLVETSEQERQAKRWIPRPQYNAFTLSNDIGLLELEEGFNLNPNVAISTLAAPHYKMKEGMPTLIIGWGTTSSYMETASSVLRKTNVSLVSMEDCRKSYRGIEMIDDKMVCASAKGKDSCQGDSGGPMYCSNEDGQLFQCALTSFGRDCADPRFPGVYTRLSSHIAWIKSFVPFLETQPFIDNFHNATASTVDSGSNGHFQLWMFPTIFLIICIFHMIH